MMLPDTEHIQPELVRQLDLLHQIAHALLGRDRLPSLWIRAELGERVKADLHATAESGR